MLYDGVSRVVFLSDPEAGLWSFVSSFLEKFANSVFVNKLLLSVNAAGRNALELDNTDNIIAATEMADYVKRVFPLKKIYSHQAIEIEDKIEFQLKIDSEFCGRIRFMNMFGNALNSAFEVSEYGMSMVVVIIDGQKLFNGVQPDMSGILDSLMILLGEQPECYPFDLLFAVSKADLFGVENTVSEEFFRENCQCCKGIIDFCRQAAIHYSFVAFSAANKTTSKVFDASGKMIADPDFESWNIDSVGLSIISNSILNSQSHYLFEMEKYIEALKTNKGIYNSESFKSIVETAYSRKQISLLLRNKYQFDQYEKYNSEISQFIKDRTFVTEPAT